MSGNDSSREETLRRLQERANALEGRNAVPTRHPGSEVASQAYKILVNLLAGVIVGIAVGAGVDWLAGTRPWGIIGGVLVGFAVSIWMAKRTADRLMALASEGTPPQAVPFDDEEA